MREVSYYFLVDDDEVVNFINQRILMKMGINARVTAFDNARTALDALEELDSSESAVVLLDINMPEMDGWEFLNEFEKLSPRLPNVKVFMLSSSIDPSDIERSKAYRSVNSFISKPLTIDKLTTALGQ